MKPILLHRSDAVLLHWSQAEADFCIAGSSALCGWLWSPHWDIPHEPKRLCPGHSGYLLIWWAPLGHDAPPRAHGTELAVGLVACTSANLADCLTMAPHVPQRSRVVSEWGVIIIIIIVIKDLSITLLHLWRHPKSQWLFVWFLEKH